MFSNTHRHLLEYLNQNIQPTKIYKTKTVTFEDVDHPVEVIDETGIFYDARANRYFELRNKKYQKKIPVFDVFYGIRTTGRQPMPNTKHVIKVCS